MNIAISGVNGFVGDSLYWRLKDNYSIYGFSTNPREPKIIKLIDGTPQVALENLDCLIHCGAVTGTNRDKADYDYGNVVCLNNLLRWSERNHVRNFIFFSSGSVYGSPFSWSDESTPLNPEDYYAESKIIGENLVLDSNIPNKTILRLYFPIGPLGYGHLVSRLADNILNNRPIFFNGEEGRPLISPILIEDVSMVTQQLLAKGISGIFNLSGNSQISIREISDQIIQFYKVFPRVTINDCIIGNYLGKADKILQLFSQFEFASIKKGIQSYLARG